MIALALALLLQGPDIPPPRGLVNDFAGVIPAGSVTRMERVAQDVRTKSGGEIAVVTLPDIGDRAPSDIALRIGREWKVGPMAEVGDQRNNLGAVILVVPKESSSTGRGRCFVATGRGAEGFITDADAAAMCRQATPYFAQQDYGRGMELLALLTAQEFAREFGFTLDTSVVAAAPPIQREQPARRRGGGINPLFLFFLLFFVLPMFMGRGRRGRRRGPGVIFIPPIGGGWGGGWGGGGSWGGGGGGGGFGGFGGGGGFSGGGGGSDW